MQEKLFDHLYHRTRIDTHIQGNIALVAVLAVLALTAESRFEPFQHGAKLWEPALMVWVEEQQSWLPESFLIEQNSFPPPSNRGPLITRSIYPIATCAAVVIGVIAAAFFIYRAARRQVLLLKRVFSGTGERPYERGWAEIRVTFWALDVVLVFLLFLLMA